MLVVWFLRVAGIMSRHILLLYSPLNCTQTYCGMACILSNKAFVVLDPHFHHLGDFILENNPGIRVPLTEDYIAEFPNQFKPYHNMFGCNLRVMIFKHSIVIHKQRLTLTFNHAFIKQSISTIHVVSFIIQEAYLGSSRIISILY
jgi:hypothetical protein